jgi:predicted lactoylglutathione lyase
MRGQLSYVTLPVRNLEAGAAFYHAVFGWNPDRRLASAVLFKLPAVTVALMEQHAFEQFIGCGAQTPGRSLALCSWNVGSAAEVNELADRARRAEAFVRREPGFLDWGGWAGVIESPDGHLWEVVWNPKHTVSDG